MPEHAQIERAIAEATGQSAHLTHSRRASGGCINDSRVISLADGRQFFLKTQPAHKAPGMFAMESRALLLLAEPDVLHVPKPVAVGEDFLVLECLRSAIPAPDWQEQMGRGLALLHTAAQQDRFGFEGDNYLGTTRQINNWQDDWLVFWRDQRLGAQLELLAQSAASDNPVLVRGRRLMEHLDRWLGDLHIPAVLLHGDLWSGNAAADEQGRPVIFDPASYYGHEEAEIGMMRLFGGFGPRCEAAYAEIRPLQAGHETRIALYRLYHELNHLNLFGAAYYQTCLSTLKMLS